MSRPSSWMLREAAVTHTSEQLNIEPIISTPQTLHKPYTKPKSPTRLVLFRPSHRDTHHLKVLSDNSGQRKSHVTVEIRFLLIKGLRKISRLHTHFPEPQAAPPARQPLTCWRRDSVERHTHTCHLHCHFSSVTLQPSVNCSGLQENPLF